MLLLLNSSDAVQVPIKAAVLGAGRDNFRDSSAIVDVSTYRRVRTTAGMPHLLRKRRQLASQRLYLRQALVDLHLGQVLLFGRHIEGALG